MSPVGGSSFDKLRTSGVPGSILGHEAEDWDNPALATMYFEAIRWALRLVDGDASPSGSRR
jgi:type 1 glutamine amidotransferase